MFSRRGAALLLLKYKIVQCEISRNYFRRRPKFCFGQRLFFGEFGGWDVYSLVIVFAVPDYQTASNIFEFHQSFYSIPEELTMNTPRNF